MSGLQVVNLDISVDGKKYDVCAVVPQGGVITHAAVCFHGWVGNFQNADMLGPGYLQHGLLYNWAYIFPQDREGVWRGGTWWLGEGGSGVYDQVVDQIIKFVRLNLGVIEQNIAFWGSSMGGYGALYHGLRREIPYICVNVPQTNIFDEEYWTFAKKFLQNMFPDIDDHERGRLCYPHGDLTTLISQDTTSLIDIEAARFDLTEHYFENHTMRFCNRLSDYGVNFRLTVNPLQMHGIIATPCEAARRWQNWQGKYAGSDRYDHEQYAPQEKDTADLIENADLFD